MIPKDPLPLLRRLHLAAESLPEQQNSSAPLGFSTRIVALARAATPPTLSALIERMSWKALALSCLLMLACAVSTYPSATSPQEEDDLQDPVSELLTLNS